MGYLFIPDKCDNHSSQYNFLFKMNEWAGGPNKVATGSPFDTDMGWAATLHVKTSASCPEPLYPSPTQAPIHLQRGLSSQDPLSWIISQLVLQSGGRITSRLPPAP